MSRARPAARSASCSAPRCRSPRERLAELHPSADAYLDAYEAATDAAIDAGFALEDDREQILADADPAAVGD